MKGDKTMKKNYIIPATSVVAIEIQQMIASTTLSTDNPSVEVSSGKYSSTFSSRGDDSWDDEY